MSSDVKTTESESKEKKAATPPKPTAEAAAATTTEEFEWEETKSDEHVKKLYSEKRAQVQGPDIDPDYTEDKLNAEIPKLAAGEDADQSFSAYDLYELAYVLVDMLDMFNSSWAAAYSRDPNLNPTHFEITEKKKKRIAKNLAVLLYKWQVKLGPVFVLVLGLLLAFGGTWKKAYSIRKGRLKEEKKALREKLNKKQQHQSQTRKKSILEVLKAGPKTVKELHKVFPKTALHEIRKELKKLAETNQIKIDTTVSPYQYSLLKTETKTENNKNNKTTII